MSRTSSAPLISRMSSNFSDSVGRPEASDGMKKTVVSRTVPIPDKWRVDRCHRLPEYGPKILFFSGGSAIRDLSAVLKHYTYNSVHLITPFDSGGSSAEIRRAFNMLSVGDLRNRLMALADDSALGNPEVANLFSFRLDKQDDAIANTQLSQLLSGKHELTAAVSMPMRRILIGHLRWFANRMPPDFDLCGASIGNLIITGCFLEHDCDIVTAIYIIWNLLGVKGVCRPLTGANLHIRTLYEDGTEEVGQHKMGKSETGSHGRIVKVDLVDSLHSDSQRQEEQTCDIDIVSAELVASADLIAFPMGSFFGSVLVNLLPRGVGKVITKRNCPKVFVPNTGFDPEMYGYTIAECASLIISLVRDDAGMVPIADILQYILVDTKNCEYCVPIEEEKIKLLGIQLIDVPLVEDVPQHDEKTGCKKKNNVLNPTKVVEVLLSLGS